MNQQTTPAKGRKLFRIPLRVYLSYLLILTFVFTAASFAKFATAGDASDSARVATFSVAASVGDDSSRKIDFNDAASKFATEQTVSYDINVTNAKNDKVSDVAVGYDVVVSFTSSSISPTALVFSIDGTVLSPVLKDGSYVYTYTGADPMPAGTETEVTHKLSVKALSSEISIDYDDIEISVSVLFEQID